MSTSTDIPAHVAIVMDGNGRWAERKNRPRTFGHQAGLKTLRKIVEHCGSIGVRELTVFAFSSENWKRPEREVNRLMELFMRALDRETKELHEKGVRVRFIGDLSAFSPEMQHKIDLAMQKTGENKRLILNVAANYGGRWDILNAARKAAQAHASGEISIDQINETYFSDQTSLTAGHDPDLLIRTGGEMRISNFLLWQAAYTELYFTETLWPDFGPEAMDRALAVYRSRERRFGLTGEQLRRSATQGS
jgi:undecaprenyl diphosphate synthase